MIVAVGGLRSALRVVRGFGDVVNIGLELRASFRVCGLCGVERGVCAW